MSKKSKANEDLVECRRLEEIEWTCPIRGKVKELVMVTRYRASKDNSLDIVKTSDPMINESPLAELAGEEETEIVE